MRRNVNHVARRSVSALHAGKTVALCIEDSALATRWRELATKSEGKKFFRDTQPKVLKVLEILNLVGAYEMASGACQHVRMASLVRGRSVPLLTRSRTRDLSR